MLDSSDDTISVLANRALDPLFHRPLAQSVASAWRTHIPFAAWIVAVCRPRVLVELGTYDGVSYTAFCEAVLREGLPTRCFAVGAGRRHHPSDYYDETEYTTFRQAHDRRYGDFSTALEVTFDDARDRIAAGSIDLLHIDDLSSYETACTDFETWKSLLSDRAVVLFHGIGIRDGKCGVWRLWETVRREYPAFEFPHGSGLGVLAVGPMVPRTVDHLCAVSDDTAIARIRHRFATLGERWQIENAILLLEQERSKESEWRRVLRADLRRTRAERDEARERVGKLQEIVNEMDSLRQKVIDLDYENRRLLNSTVWRVTRPVRVIGELVPLSVRRGLRSLMRALAARSNSIGGNALSAERGKAGTGDAKRDAPSGRVVFVSGEALTPGHTYRVLRHTEAAARAGREAIWMSIEDADRQIDRIAGASVVVIWRAFWSATVARVIATAHENGAKVVFDVDDLVFRPELATAAVLDAIRSQVLDPAEVHEHFTDMLKTIAASDACSCSTTELARHIRSFGKTTFVVPNGFDAANHAASRMAARQWRAEADDGLVRIGYAAGTRTHQQDFAQAAGALARLLREKPQCRLVLFEGTTDAQSVLDVVEFAAINQQADQIEWRRMVPLARLPDELARFDINIAPLQFGNPFCEAKSELKYFEAALVDVPTVASPTGPMSRAIRHGETGMLAATEDEWYAALTVLVDDAGMRRRLARAAYLDVLWPYGPERRAERVGSMLRQVEGGPDGAQAFALEVTRETTARRGVVGIPQTETVFAVDRLGEAAVTVIIPLHNYADFIVEALDSVRAQTLELLDLIVIDDESTDDSLAVARDWAERNEARFNRLLVLRNRSNAGLARTRNAGFDAAETPYVLPLDADNVLLPECCRLTLDIARETSAAFAYPEIQYFDGKENVIGTSAFAPIGLAGGNYIDAMALVAKPAWAAVGGYAHIEHGWEDYDFWCRFVEMGLLGVKVPDVLAEYRVHKASMLHTATDLADNKARLVAEMQSRHPWLSIAHCV